MNHPDPLQPDPNDRSPDAEQPLPGRDGAEAGGAPDPDARAEHGASSHFRHILSSVDGQLEQLQRVQNEMDEQVLALEARTHELAERSAAPPGADGDPAPGPRTEALAATGARLDDKVRETEARYRRLVEEQETFDAEREQWMAGRQEAESKLREREAELAQRERDFTDEREQLAVIAARLAEDRARHLQDTKDARESAERLETLTARCAELEGELEASAERLVELERQAKTASSAPATPGDASKMGSDVRLKAMRQKIAKLEALLAAKHPELAVSGAPDAQARLEDLRGKAERLSHVADHLRRRHYRLRQVRHLLKHRRPRVVNASAGPDPKRAVAAAEEYATKVRRLEGQRLELGEKAAALADAERRMVRRWARARSIVLVGWIFAIGVVAAAASWLAAGEIVPPVRSASITIDARSRDRAALTEEEGANWRAWHSQIVTADSFLDALAQRMDERQIEKYADPAALDQRLRRDLTVSAVDPDSMLLTLSGTDPDEVVTLLDLVASTIVVESGRLVRKRTADPWATLGGAQASLNPTPISDERLPWAGGIFGGLYLVLVLACIVTYRRLIRVKHELDADGTLFTELKPTSDGAAQAVAMIGR